MAALARTGTCLVLLVILILSTGCTGIGVRERTEAAPPSEDSTLAKAQHPAPVMRTRAAPAPGAISVMTYNLKHRDSREDLGAMAQGLRADLPRVPDIILCQEVMFGGDEGHSASLLARELNYHSRGTKRTSDREGLAILSRYPFVHYAERHLQAQTSAFLLGFRRVSVMGEFQVPGVGLVRAVNVHFTNWGFEKRIRRKQILETLAWIERREAVAPAAMTLFGGDFNAERDWQEMQWLKDRSAQRTLVFHDFNSDTPSFGPPGRPRIRLDYIFVAARPRPVELLDERVLWKDGLVKNGDDHFYPSDHLAVVHRYEMKSAPGLAISSVAE